MDKISTYAVSYNSKQNYAFMQVPIEGGMKVYQQLKDNKLYIYTRKPDNEDEYIENFTHTANRSGQVKLSVFQVLKPLIKKGSCPNFMDIYKENGTTYVCIPNEKDKYVSTIGQVSKNRMYIGRKICNKLTNGLDEYKYKVTVYYGTKAYIEICAVPKDENQEGVFKDSATFSKAVNQKNRIHRNIKQASYYASENLINSSYANLHVHILRTLNLKHGSKAQVININKKIIIIGSDEECFVTGKKINRLVDNCNELVVKTDTAEKIKVMKPELSKVVDVDTITTSTGIIKYLSEEIKNL